MVSSNRRSNKKKKKANVPLSPKEARRLRVLAKRRPPSELLGEARLELWIERMLLEGLTDREVIDFTKDLFLRDD